MVLSSSAVQRSEDKISENKICVLMRVHYCPNVWEAKENEISILCMFWGGGEVNNENHSSKLTNMLPPIMRPTHLFQILIEVNILNA